MLSGGPALLDDVLVPVGALLTLVTTVGTVHWLKGKRALALTAPLSVISVLGIAGIARVARPRSPWAAWRYSADRLEQARARFGGAPAEPAPRRDPPATAAFATVLTGVLAGVPSGAVTSLVGGLIVGHALLASSGRPASRRVCSRTVAAAVVGEAVVCVSGPPLAGVLPGVATTLVVATGAALLYRGPGAR